MARRWANAVAAVLLLFCSLVATQAANAQTSQPAEVTKTVTAVESMERWNGWAKDSRSRPGWGNVPPEPGTVTIVPGQAKQPRTFSGRVEGLESLKGAEVGIVSLSYIYWIRQKETFHWSPVAADGTFSITDDKFLDENKSVVLRAPGRPLTVFSYIFKSPEGGKDIVLKADPGKAVRVTVEVDGQRVDSFGVELFALNKAWIHENNPAGYHWSSRQWTPEKSDGSLTVYFPLRPIAAYVNGKGGAAEYQILDAREADHFHFVLLPAGQLKLTVVNKGEPAANADVQTGNENAAFSLRSGKTDDKGQLQVGGMAPGTWWLKVNKKTVEFDIEPKQILTGSFDLSTGSLKVDQPA
ncbi:MAG TPA: hypothetical protein VK968_04015, partial [Roseimicrobium sp.]|nr:hypothetical protein [Roseimicrobium sp.]